MSAKNIGWILAGPGQMIAILGLVIAPIWLLVQGDWKILLLEIVLLIAGMVILPLLFGISSSLTAPSIHRAIEGRDESRMTRLAFINIVWQSVVLFGLTALIFQASFSWFHFTITTPFLLAVLTILTTPLLSMAVQGNTEKGNDLSAVHAGIFSLGISLALLPVSLQVATFPSLIPPIISLIIGAIFGFFMAKENATDLK